MRFRLLVLVGVLLLAAAFGLYVFFLGGERREEYVRRPFKGVSTPLHPQVAKVSVEELKAYLRHLKGKGGRNPFLSSKERRWERFLQSMRMPQLQGIMEVGGERMAMMEGRWLKVGDRVKGFVLARVEEEGVVLRRGGSIYFVPLEGRR